MTETRKQIIALIEPFMDKTLSEGCYIKSKSLFPCDYCNESCDCDWETEIHYDKIILISKEYRDWKDYLGVIRWNFSNINTYIPIDNDYKILWHYDITAVLKYFWKYWKNINTNWDDTKFIIKTMNAVYWRIPNKPLHLYTEQEEIQLLNLLNKLK